VASTATGTLLSITSERPNRGNVDAPYQQSSVLSSTAQTCRCPAETCSGAPPAASAPSSIQSTAPAPPASAPQQASLPSATAHTANVPIEMLVNVAPASAPVLGTSSGRSDSYTVLRHRP